MGGSCWRTVLCGGGSTAAHLSSSSVGFGGSRRGSHNTPPILDDESGDGISTSTTGDAAFDNVVIVDAVADRAVGAGCAVCAVVGAAGAAMDTATLGIWS